MIDIENFQHALNEARQAARQAALLLQEGQTRSFRVKHKKGVEVITEYDQQSEAIIVDALKRAFPDHTIIAEEGSGSPNPEGKAIWYVDPLDGTTNFAHGLPLYTISISLEIDGVAMIGLVNAPAMNWEFTAIRGHGAFINDHPLRVSSVSQLDDALLATGFPYDRRTSEDNNLSEFSVLFKRCQGVRRLGSAALDCALVAWGMFDGYWEFKLRPWDISAGALLVQEAGGCVTNLRGGSFRSSQGNIVATNGHLHSELVAAIQESRDPTEQQL